MALADWMGFYKDEGLDVKVVDFQGGSKSLQAVVGGSADVVSGAFEHTLSMQTKRQSMQAFVLQDRAPQCVFDGAGVAFARDGQLRDGACGREV